MELTSLKTKGTTARPSIFDYTGILRSKGDGRERLGEENSDVGIEENSRGTESQSGVSTSNIHAGKR